MNDKIISVLIIVCFFTISIIPVQLSSKETSRLIRSEVKEVLVFDEILDQNQTNNSGNALQFINESIWFGQQFRPRLNILTKISIFLRKQGDFTEQSSFIISLRKHLHKELASIEINPSKISDNGSWIECDFDCIFVDVNLSYYIVCHLKHSSEPSYIEWFFDIDNPYPLGKPFHSDEGYFWDQYIHQPGFQDIDFCFKTYGFHNNLPIIPDKPNGPSEGQYEKPYEFFCKTTDQDGDSIYYQWSWGDGETSDWLGPYSSNEACTASHTWGIKGSYLVKVKAKDEWGMETDWSEPLTIRMKKNKLSYLLKELIDFFNDFFKLDKCFK
jgi:hypothetical protein